MKNGTFVLENKQGEVVRTFQLDDSQLDLIFRYDTRRVELCADTSELEKNEITYLVLARNLTKKQVEAKPVVVAGMGYLKLVSEVENFAKSADLDPESNEQEKKIYKWTTISAAVVMAFLLIVGFFFKPELNKLTENTTVVMVPRPQIEAPKKVPAPIVRPSETRPKKAVAQVQKPVKPIVQAKHTEKNSVKTKKNIARRTIEITKKASVGRKQPTPIDKMGSLSVLAQVNSKKAGTGLNLNDFKNKGAGLGTGAGGGGLSGSRSGGAAQSLYGKGLIATAPGAGSTHAEGAGGYGTRGKGGGQAGYGSMSMSGASAGYVEPMEDEVFADGGLDRDQILAVINAHRGEIVYCYEQGLQVQSQLAGRVTVNFVIGANGSVARANVSNTSLHAGGVENCILGKLKAWKFPQPVGHVQVAVTNPFILKRLAQR